MVQATRFCNLICEVIQKRRVDFFQRHKMAKNLMKTNDCNMVGKGIPRDSLSEQNHVQILTNGQVHFFP